MTFIQTPPALGNQFADDRALRSYLARTLPPDVLRDITPALSELGELAGGGLYRLQLADRLNEPVPTQWDARAPDASHAPPPTSSPTSTPTTPEP